MNDTDRRRLADGLLEAYRTGIPVDPLTADEATAGAMDLDDAYAIQLLQIEGRLKEGRVLKGHKVGLTAAVMQRPLGVDQPDFGHLLDDMFWCRVRPPFRGEPSSSRASSPRSRSC